ncbi:MAG TPA: 50S ribosomal protein L32 [Candidatus Hydrogenedentes bacterium]|nr:50S ribosomal protein L32 [Candidatus Hydrogenedentota bacterium]HOK88930.1 50S ribosomal protein L32 [Candidatus Hydrogenedentota bacterium]HPO31007.1 50S ribosomal protein L32 [Candidatus Hydrogenedentota bacterium]
MPVPKRRTGRAKQGMRRAHHALVEPNVTECPDSGEAKLPHRVCLKTGYYKGRVVIKPKNA